MGFFILTHLIQLEPYNWERYKLGIIISIHSYHTEVQRSK